jgi:hypothetical protein
MHVDCNYSPHGGRPRTPARRLVLAELNHVRHRVARPRGRALERGAHVVVRVYVARRARGLEPRERRVHQAAARTRAARRDTFRWLAGAQARTHPRTRARTRPTPNSPLRTALLCLAQESRASTSRRSHCIRPARAPARPCAVVQHRHACCVCHGIARTHQHVVGACAE